MLKNSIHLSRRQGLVLMASAGLGVALPALGQSAVAKSAKPALLAKRLRIVIPANPGGGWDQSGRALGDAMVASGTVGEVEYQNEGGKGGTKGLALYVKEYSKDPNTLLISGVVMLGALAREQNPPVDLRDIQPLARLTNDYMLVVVPTDSPIRTMRDLAERLANKTNTTPLAGGSAGSIDHIFAAGLVRAAHGKPDALNYLPFAGSVEIMSALHSGKALAGISGFGEFETELTSGKLRAIGVSSKRGMFGVPAVREFGLDVEMGNWRSVMTGKDVSPARRTEMLAALARTTADESWQKALRDKHWSSAWLPGKDFASFLEIEVATTRLMLYLLKLRTSA